MIVKRYTHTHSQGGKREGRQQQAPQNPERLRNPASGGEGEARPGADGGDAWKQGRGSSGALLPPDPTSPPRVTLLGREGVEELFARESGLLGEGGRRAWALNRVKSTENAGRSSFQQA